MHERNLNLKLTVIDGGYCVGCGACAAATSAVTMHWSESGKRHPIIQGDHRDDQTAAEACPFADGVPDETTLAEELFPAPVGISPSIGRFQRTLAAYATDQEHRLRASSGGIASSMLVDALEAGAVDYVIHVVEDATPESPHGFAYRITNKPDEVRNAQKSRYFPVGIEGLVALVRSQEARYAIVVLPCQAKALRLLSRQDERLRKRLTLIVALFCGHLKSRHYAEYLAWQLGAPPGSLQSIDFRAKLPDRKATDYATRIQWMTAEGPNTALRRNAELFGTNWGHGLFKYQACDYCDDITGETADVSVGDAWIPPYDSDWHGTNVVISRSILADSLLTTAIEERRVHATTIAESDVVTSQAAGFRHRRIGLSYRLWLKDRARKWRPTRRVAAARDQIGWQQRLVIRIRMIAAEQSHRAYLRARSQDDVNSFEQRMSLVTDLLDALQQRDPLRIAASFLKKRVRRLVSSSQPRHG